MSTDRLLHRAAHELRELNIDVPPFEPRDRRAIRYVPAVATVLLLVAGAAMLTTRASSDGVVGTDDAALVASARGTAGASGVSVSGGELSMREEVAIIKNHQPSADSGADSGAVPGTPDAPSGPDRRNLAMMA
jgi:hypothetical protein